MENDAGAETILSHEQIDNSAVVGDSTAAPAAVRSRRVKQILERRWRRKNDINTLHGLIREHSRVIAAMHSGRIPLEKGEVLSRAYGRHLTMVHAHEEITHLVTIRDKLAALRGEPSAQQLIDDDAKERQS